MQFAYCINDYFGSGNPGDFSDFDNTNTQDTTTVW